MTKSKGKNVRFTDEELEWIKENSTMPRRHLHQLFFQRPEVTQEKLSLACHRRGWSTGRKGPDPRFPHPASIASQFKKGSVPPNKGKKMPPGSMHPNSVATRFKKGQIPASRQPMGHERLDSKDGYVYVKVPIVNPHTGHFGHYVHKHRWLWEQQHGPIPEGHVLKCFDGDKTNCDPSNWRLLPKSVIPRLSGPHGMGFDDAPIELKETMIAQALIQQKLLDRVKRPKRNWAVDRKKARA